MIVVDSSVWVDYFRARETNATHFIRTSNIEDEIIVGDIILLEVLQGAESNKHARRMDTALRHFELRRMLDPALASRAARNYRILRDKGIAICNRVNLIIGTFCIEGNHGLLHQDPVFDPMHEHLGLKIII